jgi:hypothetical protein
MVPNVAHFIWITGENSRPFSYINMLAVKAAAKRHPFDRILMHTNQPPMDNKNWDRVKGLFEIVPLDVPSEFRGTPLRHVQYQADVCRLNILIEQGGVYLDTDMMLTRDVKDMLGHKLLLVEESPSSLSNAIMAAEPGSEFLRIWQDALPEALKSDVWAYHAVVLPKELRIKHPDLLSVWDQWAFFPFNLEKNWLLEEDFKAFLWCVRRLVGNHGIHAYETYWRGQFDHIDDEFMRTRNCTLTRQFGELIHE